MSYQRKIRRVAWLFVCICMLTACQPTPDEEIVIQKDSDILIEKALGDSSPTSDNNSGSAMTLKKKLNVPENYQMNADSIKGLYTFKCGCAFLHSRYRQNAHTKSFY